MFTTFDVCLKLLNQKAKLYFSSVTYIYIYMYNIYKFHWNWCWLYFVLCHAFNNEFLHPSLSMKWNGIEWKKYMSFIRLFFLVSSDFRCFSLKDWWIFHAITAIMKRNCYWKFFVNNKFVGEFISLYMV